MDENKPIDKIWMNPFSYYNFITNCGSFFLKYFGINTNMYAGRFIGSDTMSKKVLIENLILE